MLDLLPKEIWSDPTIKILDPACKTGVFLREAAKRFIEGEKDFYPDLQERLDHIFHEQLYGIAITELTSLLARRSVYCSKYPNGPFSISPFATVEGEIRYKSTQHQWKNGSCLFCGASKKQFNEDVRNGKESHAYEFIHTITPEEIYNMKFDVICSNPPYQLSDGGGVGSSAMPIYNKFIEQAKKLNPRYLTMIVPSRWFTGGRGLDQFRYDMLHDNRLVELHDFTDASDVFPGVEIKGGVCYFLWDRDNKGDCLICTNDLGKETISKRPLLENGQESFIRFADQITILKKIQKIDNSSFSTIISANDPFGFDVRVEGSYKRVKPTFSLHRSRGDVAFYYNGWRKEGVGYINRNNVKKGKDLIDKYKILFPKAWGTGSHFNDWINAFIVEPGTVCTETYLVVGPFDTKEEAENALQFIKTKFFHFMVSIVKISQNSMQNVYQYVPLPDFKNPININDLYNRYGFTSSEIKTIEDFVKGEDGE